ncbi:LolA-like outer membrane lipoprotein chaperone [Nitrosophilus alvini]|uniref:LolA-like outer membrane lipoprotein chaperone n=1 Tax=Nitrosophilus alvini TaxID=2714855 RepID=UPI00190A255C|nr:LolA-like outer membrane lipoprotein chaperone [Nitrosophilus alvini]
MKYFLFIILFANFLFASLNIFTFKSDFSQKVKDESGKIIEYKGKLYFKKPMKVLWIYKQPLKKEIYILRNEVVIIEPELEQVTISRLREAINIIEILQNAKKIDKNRYQASYNEQKFEIFTDESGNLKKIEFEDKLGNSVEIVFLNPKKNIDIDEKIFEYRIDPTFDVIYQ